MSIDSGLRFQLEGGHEALVGALDVFQDLVAHGWRADDHGRVVFLPLGDGERFDWSSRPLGELPAVWRELSEKSRRGEVLGLVLTWQDTSVGGEFLVYPDLDVRMSLSSERRVSASGVTDVTWYLERLIPALSTRWQLSELGWQEAR